MSFYTRFLIPLAFQLALYCAATYYIIKGVIWFFTDDIRAIVEEKNEKNNGPK